MHTHPSKQYPLILTQFRTDIENKRSKLFPDRKRIPGRKTKFIMSIVFLINMYTISKFLQQKRIYRYPLSHSATNNNNNDNSKEKYPPSSNQSKTSNTPPSNTDKIWSCSKHSKAKEEPNTYKNSTDSPLPISSLPRPQVKYPTCGSNQEQADTSKPPINTSAADISQVTTSKISEQTSSSHNHHNLPLTPLLSFIIYTKHQIQAYFYFNIIACSSTLYYSHRRNAQIHTQREKYSQLFPQHFRKQPPRSSLFTPQPQVPPHSTPQPHHPKKIITKYPLRTHPHTKNFKNLQLSQKHSATTNKQVHQRHSWCWQKEKR